MDADPSYIWQRAGWPSLRYDSVRVGESLPWARRAQGVVEGKLAVLGFVVEQMQAACDAASEVIDGTLVKARFWLDHGDKVLNERQRKVMNMLLDAGLGGFEGGMSTKKYRSVAATSRATASRELLELEAMGLLQQVGAGRGTRYYVKLPGWHPA